MDHKQIECTRANPAQQIAEPSTEILELVLEDLQHIAGGASSLYSACCSGKHFPTVKL
jgi:hypothetical protein